MRVGQGTLGQRGGGESRPPCTGTQGRADRSPSRRGNRAAPFGPEARPRQSGQLRHSGNRGEQSRVTVGVAGLVSVLGHVAVAVDGAAVARLNVARSGEREADRPRRRWTRRVKAQDGMRKGRRDGTALRKAPAFSWEAAMKRTASRRLDFRTSSMRSSQRPWWITTE